ncbi:hypothetical protein Scep_006851 [Stephania cephalantha]|uniref:Flavin-containing monooxygenase n=1 Tax=Stephania cephalantha TaxID=152367 RepID=A0AAP0KAC4_9MAGN
MQVHSHNYRVPCPFQGQVVVLIGSGASAFDISRDISKVAKEVHLSLRSPDVEIGKLESCDNIWQHSKVSCVYEDSKVVFVDGSIVIADIIFYCTGYNYHFPFLHTKEIVSIEDNCVGPLYKHVFPPSLAPSLSFVGIPNKVIIFRMLELQAKWVAQVLSGKLNLPSEKDMLMSVEELYKQIEEMGLPRHYTHNIGSYDEVSLSQISFFILFFHHIFYFFWQI